jgi:hypothetical protein
METLKSTGKLESKVYWIIPILIGITIKKINSGKSIYSLQLTPFIELSFCYLGTLNGSKTEK